MLGGPRRGGSRVRVRVRVRVPQGCFDTVWPRSISGGMQPGEEYKILGKTVVSKISKGENILEKVIELCKDKNKRLIIIASPTYYGINKKLHYDLKEYFKDQSVEYYNYSNFFTNQNNIEYWKDFGHLSNIGANIFTKKLAKDLNIYAKDQ